MFFDFQRDKYLLNFICGIALLSLFGCAEKTSTTPTDSTPTSIFDFDPLIYSDSFKTDALRGGRLYDKWWVVKNLSAPVSSNPVWDAVLKSVPAAAANNGSQWRCKECHGWDYKGAAGAYGPGSKHFTGIGGLNNIDAGFTAERVFQIISNGEVNVGSEENLSHSFVGLGMLEEKDVYDLTSFIMTKARFDSANNFRGNAATGQSVFDSTANSVGRSCSSVGCHSPESTTTPKLAEIIAIANENPQEFLHKVRFASPGSNMPAGMSTTNAENILAYLSIVQADDPPSSSISNFDNNRYTALTSTNIANGGLLYDKWWKVTSSATEPSATHTLWPASNTLVTNSSTWRCKACHGWDYRGKDGAYGEGKYNTGIQGVVSTANAIMQKQSADQVYSYLKANMNHGFANLFTDSEYYDLTRFIMTMRSETAASTGSVSFINDASKLVQNIDKINGESLFDNQGRCAVCHGADGKLVDFADGDTTTLPNEFLSDIAISNPWEFMHKVRFGQPGSIMSGLIQKTDVTLNTVQAAADLLAHAQSNLDPEVKRAGLLYDKWWKVEGIIDSTEPTTRNATWIANAGTTDETKISNNATWRCKQCHGWDYLGVDGAYGYNGDPTGKNYSGIRGFITLNTVSRDRSYIISAIKNGVASSTLVNHDFGRFLSDEDIGLLADFITNPDLGVPNLISVYNGFLNDGDSAAGQVIFQDVTLGSCEVCHGADGAKVPNADIVTIANENPQEFMHKVRFGQPGGIMQPGSSSFTGLSLDDASDVLAYTKSLQSFGGGNNSPSYDAASVSRGGRLFDKWWKEMQASNPATLSPSGPNPFWASRNDQSIVKTDETTWRCKNCHGWDYKGIGFYAGASSDTGADNLLYKINLRRTTTFVNDEAGLQAHIYQWIKDGYNTLHNFGIGSTAQGSPLGDREIWDLTKFLLEDGLINADNNILTNGVVINANPINGEGLYKGSVSSSVNCIVCHGIDGKISPPIDQGGSGAVVDIFAISTENPWEFMHKIRFGQPGTSMPAIYGTGSLVDKDAIDVLGYGQQQFNQR